VCIVVMAAQFYLTQLVEAMRAQTGIDFLGYLVFGRQPIEAIDDGLDCPRRASNSAALPLHTLAAAGIGEPDSFGLPTAA
jgi:hypothetical protein